MSIRSVKHILIATLTMIIFTSHFSIGFSGVSGFSMGLKVYYVDGGQFIDEVRGRYLIKHGLLSTAEILREIVSSITDWNIKYPVEESIMLPYISFDGLFNNLSTHITDLVGVDGEYTFVSVSNDVVFISTSNADAVLNNVESNRDLITSIYMDSLMRYLDGKLGLDMTLPDIIRGLRGSIKVVLFEIPNQGYKPISRQYLMERFEEMLPTKPDYIGGFGYDPIYGVDFFLIYLSCNLNGSSFEYSIDEVLDGIDSYLYEFYEGSPPPVLLMAGECVFGPPDFGGDRHKNMDDGEYGGETEYDVDYTLMAEYNVEVSLSQDESQTEFPAENNDVSEAGSENGENPGYPVISAYPYILLLASLGLIAIILLIRILLSNKYHFTTVCDELPPDILH